jgi:hypothetical protein
MSASRESVEKIVPAAGLAGAGPALWRQLGLTRSAARIQLQRIVLGALVPQILFFLGLRQGGVTAGLVASAAWTIGLLMWELVWGGGMNPLLLYGLLFTAAQGTIVLWTQNAAVYAAGGMIENLLGGLLFIGSAVICRPLLVDGLGSMIPQHSGAILSGTARVALERLTVLWGLALLARAAGLFAALTHLSLGQFLLVNTLAGWPLNGVGLLLSVAYIRVQFPSLLSGAPWGAGTCPADTKASGCPFPACAEA